MRSALLISNSTSHGSGYLDHCEGEIKDYLGSVIEVLFIPYAIPDMDEYATKAVERFNRMGCRCTSIHEKEDLKDALLKAEAIFIGGGNTFLLLRRLYDNDLVGLIGERVRIGMKYIGTSAGSNVAFRGINTTNDMPIVQPPSLEAIGILPIYLNPHYIDPDPDSTHKGETRQQRIDQFHELDPAPVLGLREGAMLLLMGNDLELRGPTGAKLFRKGIEPEEFAPGADLSFLLQDD